MKINFSTSTFNKLLVDAQSKNISIQTLLVEIIEAHYNSQNSHTTVIAYDKNNGQRENIN
jgi:hypothetical protein